MKFCANCGTKMSDEINTCPQCGYSFDNNTTQPITNPQQNIPTEKYKSQSKKNKPVKWSVLIPIVVIISIITSIVVSSLFGNFRNYNYITPSSTEVCPASEYGNHDWGSATCIEPAQCRECGTYKDNQLGNHKWWENSYGFEECYYCDMLYDDYVDLEE